MEYVYDDSRLYKMWASLDERSRVRVLKGGLRRAAGKVRKAAVSNLRAAIRSDRDLERGIRVRIGKQQPSFTVTGAFDRKSGRGFHLNRFGQLKPVLLWAEDGTAVRSTKSNGGKRLWRARAGHNTGKMTRVGFMDAAKRQCAGTVSADVSREILSYTYKTARKYGCE